MQRGGDWEQEANLARKFRFTTPQKWNSSFTWLKDLFAIGEQHIGRVTCNDNF